MRVLDLFSGIGGFSYGLELASPKFKTVQFVEIDEYCRKVLQLRWPGVPIHDDIRNFTARPGRFDLVTAGWPCQPWSKAGKQLGAEDDRDLWPEVRRVIEAARPRWFLGENVRAIIDAPMGLNRSVSDLESLGYEVQCFVVPAIGVDAKHIRARCFLVGVADADQDRREVKCPSSRSVQRNRRADPVRGGKDVPDAGSAGLSVSKQDELPKPQRHQEGRTATQCHRWPAEPPVGRVAHGVPKRVHRLRCLGNSVVPQVVAQFGRAIIGADE